MKLAILAAGLVLSVASFAHADEVSVAWPSRNSVVICGGSADQVDLKMRVVVENELLAAEADNGRALIYVDLHKPGQARVVTLDGLSDEEFEKREAILAKLSPEDREFLKALASPRQSDFYLGFYDGFIHLDSMQGKRTLSFSCQELSR